MDWYCHIVEIESHSETVYGPFEYFGDAWDYGYENHNPDCEVFDVVDEKELEFCRKTGLYKE